MARPSTRKTANALMIAESILNLIVLPLSLAAFGMAFIPLSELFDTQAEIAELKEMYDPASAALITSIIVNFYGEMKTSPETEPGGAAEENEQA